MHTHFGDAKVERPGEAKGGAKENAMDVPATLRVSQSSRFVLDHPANSDDPDAPGQEQRCINISTCECANVCCVLHASRPLGNIRDGAPEFV